MAGVLIVDDDRDIVEAVTMALALEGHEAFATDDPDEAVTLVRRHGPGLALVDYLMPGVDVPVLIARLRRAAPLMRVVLCTASPRAGIVEDVGADQLLAKPFHIDELAALLGQPAVAP